MICYFFLQAEDGIRDYKVTGVQTCALPIYRLGSPDARSRRREQSFPTNAAIRRTALPRQLQLRRVASDPAQIDGRSEERRVGKEGRRWCVQMYAEHIKITNYSRR